MLRAVMADDPDDGLSGEETSVLLGCFAGASTEALAGSTGLPLARIDAIVAKLASRGLIDAPAPVEEAASGPRSAQDDLVALLDFAMAGLDPPGEAPQDAPSLPSEPPSPGGRGGLGGEVCGDGGELSSDGGLGGEVSSDGGAEPAPAPAADADADADPGATREYQKVFQTELRPLPVEQRIALAGTVSGPRLFAFCFDPDPTVIVALLDNPGTTAEHARLVAFHHRTSRGIDELGGRAVLVSDGLVHRRLLRNPSLGEPTLRRLMGSKRLLEVYKMTLDRDIPERTRSAGRALFRARFGTAAPEERVDVVWATEGRALTAMAGLTFDSRTTSILCSRTYASIMLIQNLTRFPATPPGLIAHLLKQPIVKRQVHLKNQLLSHPNTPSEAKRKP
jgi:hypothetical protein